MLFPYGSRYAEKGPKRRIGSEIWERCTLRFKRATELAQTRKDIADMDAGRPAPMPKNKRYVEVAKRVQSIVEDYDNRSPQNYCNPRV